MNFCFERLCATHQGCMHRDFAYHFRGGEKTVKEEREKKKEEAFLRRGLNGFTICFGGAGSCIITCLLVHCFSSSVSQLKQPSVCSYLRKRWHTNQAVPLAFSVCLRAQLLHMLTIRVKCNYQAVLLLCNI